MFVFMVIGLVLVTFAAINYYIGSHGWRWLGQHIPRMNKRLYWLSFWLVAFSFPLAEMSDRFLPNNMARVVNLLGGYWLVAMVYFVLVLLLIDMIRLTDRRFRYLPAAMREGTSTPTVTAITVLGLVLATIGYGAWNAKNPVVNSYNLSLNKKVAGLEKLHIVMVSDIHIGNIIPSASLTKLVQTINQQKPDVIVIAGDIVDGAIDPEEEKSMGRVLAGLDAKYGAFAVPGNHDHFGNQLDSLAVELEQAGVEVLKDERIKVNEAFYIIGRDNASEHNRASKRKELSKLLAGVDTSLPLILLDHQPVDVDNAQKGKIDLQLSGHTHYGQFFPFNLVTGRIFAEDWGLYNRGEYNLIVSSGYGTWGPPVRIGNRPEVVSIELTFK